MKKLIFAGALLLSAFAMAQVGTHTVQPQETIYGISKEYNISQEELIEANPFLNERILKVGDVLTIPGKTPAKTEIQKPQVDNYEDDNFRYLNIEPKETLYSLSKRYNISQDQIKSLNPFIEERGLQIGDIIRLPKAASKAYQTQASEVVPAGMHLVKAGETVYSIAKSYGVEMADIYAANREVQTDGLKKGSYIKIPTTKNSIKTPVTKSTQSFEHKVEKEETIFSILRKYDIRLEELIAANPTLENGLQAGMVLQIPVAKGAKLEEAPKMVKTNTDNFADKEINVALIMPFFLDDISKNKGERQVAQDFYVGAQVALKEIIKKGKKINLEIIDSKNNKQEIVSYLESEKIDKVDAIVGPFFQDLVVYTAQKLENTQIPIFSPLISSQGLEQYSNVYMATPRDEYAVDIIVDEMANAYNGNQVVKILTTDKENNIAEYLKAQFLNRFKGANVIITKNPADLNLVEHKEIITDSNGEETENVTYEPALTVLASENNTLGYQYVNTITKQDPASIDGFSIYFVPALDIFDTKNIDNINALKEIGFTYTAIRMVNTFGKNEKDILKVFQDEYCTVPTKYMSIGYDVMYDVLDRMNNSGKISDFDAKRAETRLSSKFSYEQAEGGKAKINKELRVIRLKK
ncbi:MAG: amino acid ABC transporter substrate-binding protein [Weeksellaceae bacterium]